MPIKQSDNPSEPSEKFFIHFVAKSSQQTATVAYYTKDLDLSKEKLPRQHAYYRRPYLEINFNFLIWRAFTRYHENCCAHIL